MACPPYFVKVVDAKDTEKVAAELDKKYEEFKKQKKVEGAGYKVPAVYRNKEQVLQRIKMIIAMQESGNDSDVLYNEAVSLNDMALVNNWITDEVHEKIKKLLIE